MQLEQLRAAVKGERVHDVARAMMDERPQMGGMAPAPSPRAVIDVDDLNALATRHRREGEAEGYQNGYAQAQLNAQAELKEAEKRAETRGAIVGLQAAADELFVSIESNEGQGEGEGRVAVHDAVVELLKGMREEGLHGERAPRTDGAAAHDLIKGLGRL